MNGSDEAGRIHAGTLSVDTETVEVVSQVQQARTTSLDGGSGGDSHRPCAGVTAHDGR